MILAAIVGWASESRTGAKKGERRHTEIARRLNLNLDISTTEIKVGSGRAVMPPKPT